MYSYVFSTVNKFFDSPLRWTKSHYVEDKWGNTTDVDDEWAEKFSLSAVIVKFYGYEMLVIVDELFKKHKRISIYTFETNFNTTFKVMKDTLKQMEEIT